MAYALAVPDDDGPEELNEKDRATRQDAAVALRIAGATYSEIMRTLGYTSVSQARIAVEKGIAATVGEDDRDQQRFLEARRLERLLRGVWKKAGDDKDPDHIGYVRTALAIIDRHAKLLGLDAPTEMVVYNPSASELEDWIAKKTALHQKNLPQEVDIIDGEVIESDAGDDA